MAGEPRISKINGYVDSQVVSLRDFVERLIANLKEHFETKLFALERLLLERFIALEKRLDERQIANEKAVLLALQELKVHLTVMNKFRDEVQDITSQNVTRVEFAAFKEGTEKAINELEKYRAGLEGKASQKEVYIAFVLSIVIGIIMKFIKI